MAYYGCIFADRCLWIWCSGAKSRAQDKVLVFEASGYRAQEYCCSAGCRLDSDDLRFSGVDLRVQVLKIAYVRSMSRTPGCDAGFVLCIIAGLPAPQSRNVCVLRAVTTTDFMTADWYDMPHDSWLSYRMQERRSMFGFAA